MVATRSESPGWRRDHPRQPPEQFGHLPLLPRDGCGQEKRLQARLARYERLEGCGRVGVAHAQCHRLLGPRLRHQVREDPPGFRKERPARGRAQYRDHLEQELPDCEAPVHVLPRHTAATRAKVPGLDYFGRLPGHREGVRLRPAAEKVSSPGAAALGDGRRTNPSEGHEMQRETSGEERGSRAMAPGLRAQRRRWEILCEGGIELLIRLCGISAIVFVFAIFFFVFREGAPLLPRLDLQKFLFTPHWHPTSLGQPRYGVGALILGTLSVTGLSMALAVPF